MNGDFNVIGTFGRDTSRGFKDTVALDIRVYLEVVEFAAARGFVTKLILRCGQRFEHKVSEGGEEFRVKFGGVKKVYDGLG